MPNFFCLTVQDTAYCPECEMRHGECLLCGGWLHREKEDGYDGQHCCQECAEEAAAFAARAKRERETNWCPSCGYDNHEHGPDCEASGTPVVPELIDGSKEAT
jgi:hypothetical protein